MRPGGGAPVLSAGSTKSVLLLTGLSGRRRNCEVCLRGRHACCRSSTPLSMSFVKSWAHWHQALISRSPHGQTFRRLLNAGRGQGRGGFLALEHAVRLRQALGCIALSRTQFFPAWGSCGLWAPRTSAHHRAGSVKQTAAPCQGKCTRFATSPSSFRVTIVTPLLRGGSRDG